MIQLVDLEQSEDKNKINMNYQNIYIYNNCSCDWAMNSGYPTNRIKSNSSKNSVYRQKPKNFRMVLKNRNGSFIENDQSSSKKQSAQISMNSSMINLNYKGHQQKNIKKFVQTINSNKHNPSKTSCSFTIQKQQILNPTNSQSKMNKTINFKQSQIFNQSKTSLQESQYPVDLQTLQKRIDDLVKKKLSDSNTANEVAVNDQIEKIIHHFRSELQDINGPEANLQDVNKKINILEKLLAHSLVESQVLKKNFYDRLSNKTKNKFRSKSINTSEIIEAIKTLKKYNSSSQSDFYPKSLQKQSLASSSFKKPHKGAYVKPQQRRRYQYRHQSLPRSSYSRQFLHYQPIPPFKYKQENNNIFNTTQKMNLSSSYRQQFTKKPCERINYRQLDSYHDKLRNLKISFNNQKGAAVTARKQQLMTKYSINRKNNEKKLNTEHSSIDHIKYPKRLCTENQDNYRSSTPVIKSMIKHKNISNLKFGYRKYANF